MEYSAICDISAMLVLPDHSITTDHSCTVYTYQQNIKIVSILLNFVYRKDFFKNRSKNQVNNNNQVMKIMITDSKGESISITIGENGNFKELIKQVDDKDKMPESSSEMDAKVLVRLSNNNGQNCVSEGTDSALELLEAQVKSCLSQIETEPYERESVAEATIQSDEEDTGHSESSNSLSLCRLCATRSEDLIHIFGSDCEPYRNIIQKIEDCLPIMVTRSDTLPKEACRSCLEKLDLCHKFYATVSEAEKQFLALGGKISYESEDVMKYCETMGGEESSDTKEKNRSLEESVYDNSDKEDESEKKSNRIKCQICGVAFRTVGNCQTHSRIHVTENYYPCSLCEEIFTIEKEWNEHIVDHDSGEGGESERKGELICKRCGIKLDPENDCCEACDEVLDSDGTPVDAQGSNDRSNSVFSCDICRKRFSSQASVNAHQRIHRFVQGRSFMCEICNKRFYSEDSLEMHKVSHAKSQANDSSFTCYYCGRIFAQKGNLESHIRSHSKSRQDVETREMSKPKPEQLNRPFKCVVCEKRFDHSARLREHSRVHSGKRPYDCSVCNKSFKRASARKVHMITHSDERPYNCQLCGSNFRRSGDLRRHIQTQHNQK